MYKVLFDSDALIKIAKAEFIVATVECFDVLITEDVYNETVEEGKKGFYADADKIEELVKQGRINVLKVDYYKKGKKPKQSFGIGETSVFQAYKKGRLVVTDDLSFALYLEKKSIKYLSSAHILLMLLKKHKLTKDEAYHCLEKMKPFIRRQIYEIIKKDIGG